MNKSEIEKQLKKELSAAAPSNFDAVWNKCETPAAEAEEFVMQPVPVSVNGDRTGFGKRRIIPIAAAALAVMLCCAAIICYFALDSGGGLVKPSESGYFMLDINPSVRVDYDTEGAVTAARGLNSDGERLLNGLELYGLSYDKAVNAIFDRCVVLDYFSDVREDNAVLMTASKTNGEKDAKMTEQLNNFFMQSFEDKKMTGIVISDVDNGKWQKEAEKYGINGQKYELILRCKELGGKVDESEYGSITIHDLYSRIKEAEKTSKDEDKQK